MSGSIPFPITAPDLTIRTLLPIIFDHINPPSSRDLVLKVQHVRSYGRGYEITITVKSGEVAVYIESLFEQIKYVGDGIAITNREGRKFFITSLKDLDRKSLKVLQQLIVTR